LEDSQSLVKETVTCVRGVMADLRPPLLDDYGLAAVLRWYCREFSERSGIAAVAKCDEQTPRFPFSTEIALFRIVQEALTNVMKHARADQVIVTLETAAEAVRMTITDNGVGFDPEDTCHENGKRSCWGMLGMRERAEMIGGHFGVKANPGGGTRVVVEVAR
jgi:two-component system sensor histidine kinase UhpB